MGVLSSALRKFVGLTQVEFARAIEISVHTLRNWEQGGRQPEGPAIALLRIAARSAIAKEQMDEGTLPREALTPVDATGVMEVTRANQSAFAELHDRLFPTTYYNGAELVERLNENRRAWLTEDLLGYIYVECKPDHGWASLEFVGVDEAADDVGQTHLLRLDLVEPLQQHADGAGVVGDGGEDLVQSLLDALGDFQLAFPGE